MSAASDRKPLVVIGISGSHDYLTDTTGDRRFWPIRVPAELAREPLSPEERAAVERLAAMSPGLPASDESACDGIHDEGAPPQYLCTRCFPDPRGDLAVDQDDVGDDVGRDPEQEME